jgi:hypothetical protein
MDLFSFASPATNCQQRYMLRILAAVKHHLSDSNFSFHYTVSRSLKCAFKHLGIFPRISG